MAVSHKGEFVQAAGIIWQPRVDFPGSAALDAHEISPRMCTSPTAHRNHWVYSHLARETPMCTTAAVSSVNIPDIPLRNNRTHATHAPMLTYAPGRTCIIISTSQISKYDWRPNEKGDGVINLRKSKC